MDLSAIGQQFGLTEEQTRAAFDALTPVVASGMRRSAQSENGLQDILSSALNGNQNVDAASGNEILGQIFGSKDVSRGVAQQLSATSGVGAAVLKQLLPIVASIVMGQVAKKMGGSGQSSGGGGGLGDILGDILGGGQQPQQRQQPQSGGGGLGDILGDILGGGQQQSGGAGGGGLGDILKDVLGGGGAQQQQAPSSQGGSLEDMLKEILGGGAPQETVTHGRKRLDDVLGGGTRKGSDADILLDSVTRSVRR